MSDLSGLSHIYSRSFDPGGQDSLAKIARLVKPGSEVLDLGAGPGVLGRHLSENLACTVDGVEYNPLAAEQGAAFYRHLRVADLEQVSLASLFQEVRYDYIICADILEHLRNPGGVVEQLADFLKPDGRLLISIPNVAYAGLIADLLADDFRYRPEGLLDETHLRFFTRTSLLAFLAEHGFVVCSQDSTVMNLRDSEFRAGYLDTLPPALLRGLLARPDALTYQFIIEAKAATNRESQEPPKPPAASPELRFACQLFWRWENEEYSQGNSSFAFGCIGKDRQTLSLAIPPSAQRITALRLDLSDRPGLLRLFAVSLHDHEGRPCWKWDGHGNSLESTPHCQIVFSDLFPGSEGVVTVLLAGEDPSFELPIPEECLTALEKGGELRFQLNWPMSMDYLVLVQQCVPRKEWEILKSHRAVLEARQIELESYQAALAARQVELESQNAELKGQLQVLSTGSREREQLLAEQAEELERLRQVLSDIKNSTIWRWSRPYVNVVTRLSRKLKTLFF